MDIDHHDSWHERPGPTIAAGVALLIACAGFAALWLTSSFALARPLGLVTGAAGIYLLVGGVMSRKVERTDG